MTQSRPNNTHGNTAMKITVVKPDKMGPDLVKAWCRLLEQDKTFGSPFFHPQFTQTVARLRPDVEVAVLTEGDREFGFFPFQRLPGNRGRPVGGRMSDFQGVIAPTGHISAPDLLRGIGLSTWNFNNLLVSQTAFKPYFSRVSESAGINIPNGWDAYVEDKGGSHFRYLKNAMRKCRKMEREIGPLRFEMQVADETLLLELIKLKSRQYHRMGVTDVFSYSWTVDLLKLIFAQNDPVFGGVLSALYAGDHLVALHMGMRTRKVLHCWFPAYDAKMAKYSPGVLLFFEIMKAAHQHGIERIDLGRTDQWKIHLMNCTQEVAEGGLDLRLIRGPIGSGWRHAKEWFRASPLNTHFKTPARIFSRLKNRIELQ